MDKKLVVVLALVCMSGRTLMTEAENHTEKTRKERKHKKEERKKQAAWDQEKQRSKEAVPAEDISTHSPRAHAAMHWQEQNSTEDFYLRRESVRGKNWQLDEASNDPRHTQERRNKPWR